MRERTPRQLLTEYFGFDDFRNSQEAIIDHVIRGSHAMVVMPTGMGKSLCYQIPALFWGQETRNRPGFDLSPRSAADDSSSNRPPIVLVLSPLIALMQDQVDALLKRGIDATFINSSLDRPTRIARYESLAAGDYEILFVTPERFRKDDFRDALAEREVKLLAIDEAHCVSQWGHDFRPDYTRAAEIRKTVGNPTTIALTATATVECRDDIFRQLQLEPSEIKLFHEGIDRPNLALDVISVYDEEEKQKQLCELLLDPEYRSGSAIVYFSLIKTLQRFSDHLTTVGMDHVCYHGDLPRNVRRRVQDEFMSGETDLVLATNAFGMGIDKEDIRMVIHAETPGSIESYYQEIGRAGRDGLPSRCVWLYAQEDLMTQMQFIEWSNPDAAFYTRLYQLMVEHNEQCRAFGIDWMNQQLQRRSKHDHRIATAIAILDRHGVLAGPRAPECFEVLGPLPTRLQDDEQLAEKKRRDQQRLYAMVQLAAETGDRKEFLNRYFMD